MLAAANCSGMRRSRTVVSGMGSRRFGHNVIIRKGFWGILHYKYNKEPRNKAPVIVLQGRVKDGFGYKGCEGPRSVQSPEIL